MPFRREALTELLKRTKLDVHGLCKDIRESGGSGLYRSSLVPWSQGKRLTCVNARQLDTLYQYAASRHWHDLVFYEPPQ